MFPSPVAKDSAARWSGHHESPLPNTDSAEAAGSNIPPNIVLGIGSIGFVEGMVRPYRPRPRPMISFMISVVPPKMDWTRLSVQARPTAYSRM